MTTMGKKRTNGPKKKQARKKKLSSAYGVSVLKGGTQLAREKHGANLIDDGNGDGNAVSKQRSGVRKNTGEGKSKHQSLGDNPLLSPHDTRKKRSPGSGGEREEFQRMHNSLEERSLTALARKQEQRKRKNGQRRHQQKKGWGKFTGPSFAQATLNISPKSTNELVNDAADQIARGMSEIGQKAVPNMYDGLQVAPGQSSLAAAASLNWQLRVSNNADSNRAQQQSPTEKNSFAALEDNSDSDNEWEEKNFNSVKQFQFKPASFTFQSTVSKPPAGDVDPDL